MELEEKVSALFAKEKKVIEYPDFDAMWSCIQAENSSTALAQGNVVRWKRTVVILSVTALCLATPAFAFDWNLSGLFNGRSGIQSALNQGLGQKLNRSVTESGVTITLEHALVDENRTVILYRMDIGAQGADQWYFNKVTLIDKHGKEIEGSNQMSSSNEKGVIHGIFESDWVPASPTEHVDFIFEDLSSVKQVTSPLALRMDNAELQRFPINQDGIVSVNVQPFVQNEELLLSSAVTFKDDKASKSAYPALIVKYQNDMLKAKHASLGEPGQPHEYKMKQTYASKDVLRKDVTFWLQYSREESLVDDTWTFGLELDKRSMRDGTVKTKLDAQLNGPNGAYRFVSMLATPTQIRIRSTHDEPYMMYPFMDYELKIGNTRLRGGQFIVENHKHNNEFRFERPPGLEMTKGTPISLVGKYEVAIHSGSNKPIELKGISEAKQSITAEVGEYPVKWTYYRKDGDVYVESGSDERRFGGVNQTYRLTGNGNMPSEPISSGFYGDGNNRLVERYKNYSDDDLTIYIYYYAIEDPDKQIEVPLLPVE